MSRKKVFLLLLISLFFSYTDPLFASDQSSANFQSLDSSFVPAVASQQSPNFQILGGVEPIVGVTQSSNFISQSGVPLPIPIPPTPTPTPSGGGGGGGGGGFTPTATTTPPASSSSTLPLPTLEYRRWTFKNKGWMRGKRMSDLAHILLNGSEDGVELLTGARWQKELPLFLGSNQVIVQQRLGQEYSDKIYGLPRRRLIGDVNDDRVVDDVDISLLTRAWKVYTEDADFNEDALVDDIDLSLLVAHWGQSY